MHRSALTVLSLSILLSGCLLGDALPPERVFTVAVGHDWKAWRALWEKAVESAGICS